MPAGSCAPAVLENLSTATIEPAHRFEVWRHRAHRMVTLEPPVKDASLNAELMRLSDGNCTLGTMRSSAYAARADPKRHPACAEGAVITTVLSGEVNVLEDSDERTRVRPAALAFYDLAHAARYQWMNASREAYIALPRADAIAALGSAPRGLIVPLEHCTLAPALRSQLAVVSRLAPTLTSDERSGLLAGARALALLVLRQAAHPEPCDDATEDAFGSVAAGRRAAALYFMEQHAHDPELNIAAIARGASCSRTRLCAAFTDNGETVMGALRELRLQRSRAALERGVPTHLGALAWHCGFADSSTFSRLFKQRFGVSPGEFSRRAQTARLTAAPRTTCTDQPSGSGR